MSEKFLDLFIHSYLPNSAMVFRTKNQKKIIDYFFTPTCSILHWFSEQKVNQTHRPTGPTCLILQWFLEQNGIRTFSRPVYLLQLFSEQKIRKIHRPVYLLLLA